jgi:RluA family pseudouridine synthase
LKRLQTRLTGIPKERLDLFLQQWLPHALDRPLSRSLIRKLILTGGVYVNRHRCVVPVTPIYSGAVIEVFFDEARLTKGRLERPTPAIFRKEWILYEDDWLIAVNKPAFLPTQPTLDPNRANLYQLLGAYRREVEPKSYLGLHHRLDRDTSGVVLFTKREEANPGVSRLFSEHQIQKTYHCIAWRTPGDFLRKPDSEYRIDNFLAKVKTEKGKARYGSVKQGGFRAITDFRILETFPSALWIEARPQTGRTHQIRVHCAEAGAPILGDELYFPVGVVPFHRPERLMLHAMRLEFEHPIKKFPLKIEAPQPQDMMEYLSHLGRDPQRASK